MSILARIAAWFRPVPADMLAKPADRLQVAPAMLAKPAFRSHEAPDAAAFIAQFEGFRAAPYLCPAGVPTIGYGTTRYPAGAAVTLADPPCTKAQALAWLAHDLSAAGQTVDRLVKVPLSDSQRVALLSLTYNIGADAFGRSTLLRLLNGQRYGDAGREFPKWVKAGGVTLPGLVTRRAAEQALWNAA